MPELPEVETIRRGLALSIEGRRITAVTVRRGDLRRPVPEDFVRRLGGRRVEAVGRRAKYLLIGLDSGETVIAHLGMSGRLYARNGGAHAPHEHLVFAFDDGTELVFNDARRFGLFDLAPTEAVADHVLLRHLGPDPLGPGFDGGVLSAALAGRRAPIKALLLDQRMIAGLGNIYACESLYRAGISPRRSGASVAGARAHRLAEAIAAVLEDAIAAGGSTLRDYVQASGELGYFQHSFKVYARAGESCPTAAEGHVVRRIVQSNRSTFYCPLCQR
jgi:formamidopyrimidine-DNA glycosylase